MFSYDGTSFQKTRQIVVVSEDMQEDKESWMKEYSLLVDSMFFALKTGGIVKNVVVGCG